jgi:tRNA modification GTPase
VTEDAEAVANRGAETWVISNKCDLVSKNYNQKSKILINDSKFYRVSVQTGEGLRVLSESLASYAGRFFSATEPALVTRQRQRSLLASTAAALSRTLDDNLQSHVELVAEELRTAATALGRLTGRIDVEDVLDTIFRDFCIGK